MGLERQVGLWENDARNVAPGLFLSPDYEVFRSHVHSMYVHPAERALFTTFCDS